MLDFNLDGKYRELRDKVRELGKAMEHIPDRNPEGYTDPEMVRMMAEAGLFGLFVPQEYGGNDATGKVDAFAIALCRENLSITCPEAEFIFAMQALGSVPIILSGTEEQKKHYLPGVVSGETLAAFALSESDAGSDAANLSTEAVLSGNNYVLNGKKVFISNLGVAGFYIVFAKTDPTKGARGVSAFIVEADRAGLVMKNWEMMAQHPIGELSFNNCIIPKENLLGEECRGFRVAMQTLDVLRTSVGAFAVGIAQRALNLCIEYTQQRKTFGKSLAEHQTTQNKLAEMVTLTKAARLLVYHSAWVKNQGHRITMESSMAKWYATEMAGKVVDHAVQIHGGYGIMKKRHIEFLYRLIRSCRVYEGASEIQQMIIARELFIKTPEEMDRAILS